MADLSVLVAANSDRLDRYEEYFALQENITVLTATSHDQVSEHLEDPSSRVDVLVIDAAFGEVPTLLKEVQRQYRAVIMILVDEGADFAMPGRAHDVSTDPFTQNDLVRRIKRLVEEQRLETLRADALPPVRSFARQIRKASPGESKREAAVAAVQQLGFDYAAFYSVDWTDPPQLSLIAQVGPKQANRAVPDQAPLDTSDIIGWVADTGISQLVGPDDELSHPLIADGVFGSGACVPVGINLRFGVILACRQQPNAISAQDLMMLELVAAQLAAALAAEARERKKR
jgi:hypothetical protein